MTWVFTLRALVVQYICQTSLPSDPEGARTLRQLKDLPTPRPYFAVKIDSLKRTGKLFFTLSYIANSLLVCHYCSILSTLQKRGLQHTRNNVAISKLQWNSMIKDTITIKNCHWDETSCFATTTTFPSSFIKIYLKKTLPMSPSAYLQYDYVRPFPVCQRKYWPNWIFQLHGPLIKPRDTNTQPPSCPTPPILMTSWPVRVWFCLQGGKKPNGRAVGGEDPREGPCSSGPTDETKGWECLLASAKFPFLLSECWASSFK